ncbi:SF3a splicing factor complex subunit [Coemansia sp. RSA 2607]|nr:SF3a splicing factor complex subunit [Coemansia sp. RSA 2607]
MGDAEAPAGMIYPPQDIRTMIDKTAAHVAKSGAAFEKLLQDKYQGNARFSFMQTDDPYHAYYAHRVSLYQSGGDAADTGTTTDERMDVENAHDAGGDEKDKAEDEEEAYEPTTEQFGGALPLVSAHDLAVLRLAAQFVARNGRSFLQHLGHFAFAHPAHTLHAFFQRTVAQYSAVMFPPPDLTRSLQLANEGRPHVLERAARRLRSVARMQEEERRKEEEAQREREAVAAIDWQDFSVVGTVEFVEEDEAPGLLPPPLRLRDVQMQSLTAAVAEEVAAAVPAFNPAPVSALDPVAAPPVSEPTPQPTQPAAPAGMRIRHDYVPTLRRGQAAAPVLLRCQLCGQDVAAAQFDEHLRVELVDPRWKEQRAAYERRFRDSNLVQDGGDIARYLRRLADASAEHQAPRAVPWDGFSASAGMAAKRAREMHAKEVPVPGQPTIGPAAGPPRKRSRNEKT